MSEEVAGRFRCDHGPQNLAEFQQTLDDFRHGVQRNLSPPPTIESVVWLLDALRHGDDPDGIVMAHLALLYGVTKRSRKMLRSVRQALTITPTLRAYFLDPDQLIILANGCGNDKGILHELGDVLGTTLPAAKDQVCQSIEQMDLEDVAVNAHGIVWWVMGQPSVWVQGPAPSFPAPVRIFLWEESGERRAQACYVLPIPYQPLQSRCVPDGAGEAMPVKELVRELTRLFLFVCPIN